MPLKDVLPIAINPIVEKSLDQELSGSQALILSLIDEGVKDIFGYPGGAIMPIYDALHDYSQYINHYLVRHEQGAIHAAQGFARVGGGRVGVVFATSGPGATNLVTGLADALIDSTPLVAITGQVASPLLGTDAFQEVDVINISTPVTKWNVQVTQAKDINLAIRKAFFIASSGRPGPVLVDITKDAQFQKTIFKISADIKMEQYKEKLQLPHYDLKPLAELINGASRPYILAGQGVLLGNAVQEVQDFSLKANIPIASTLLGLSAIPTNFKNYVGYLGMHGNYAPNLNTNACDVLIAIGMRFDDRVTGDLSRYAKQAKIVHIEIDDAEINKNVFTHFPVLGDCKKILAALTPAMCYKERKEWFASFDRLWLKEKEIVLTKEFDPAHKSLKMSHVVASLSDITESKAVIVTDVGQHQMVTSRYFKYKYPYTNVTSGGLGTMGFALPAAMGCAVAQNHFPVIAIIGDGGIQMTIQELGTLMEFGLPVKIVILNNEFLGMVRQWQQLFFQKRYSFVNMKNPDFVRLASAYNIPACKLTDPKGLDGAIETMLETSGPYLLEVMVEKEENVFPMIPTGACVSDVRLI